MNVPSEPQIRALQAINDGIVHWSPQRLTYSVGGFPPATRRDVIRRCVDARWAEPAYACRQCHWVPVRLTDEGRKWVAVSTEGNQ